MKIREIARLLGGEVAGDADLEICRLSKIEDAGEGDITFYANPKYAKYLSTTAASAILIARDADPEELRARVMPIEVVRVDDAYRAFLKLLEVFYPPAKPLVEGVHPRAVVAGSAVIGRDAAIGACVIVGERCRIGHSVALHPGTVLYEDAEVGDGSILYANVTVREQCRIGRRVIIHPGAVIGADGFGFAPAPDGSYEKIPQRGIVVVEDDVEIGANCTIDRATIGETRIERGVKLDNLIHIAHNASVGEFTVIAAQTGISGSTKLGRHCLVGGQVGFIGHIEIPERTSIGAQSGIAKSIVNPGQSFFGSPAKEHRQALRTEGAIRQLPELLVEVRTLQRQVAALEARLKELQSTKGKER